MTHHTSAQKAALLRYKHLLPAPANRQPCIELKCESATASAAHCGLRPGKENNRSCNAASFVRTCRSRASFGESAPSASEIARR
eukprot:4642966-Pleurochrysis_carterae.AAC.1